ncbi:putative small lipoprotein YifL [Hymenobacter luteus]|uniref:Small lipoprotein YifL n=2 Tax=Hymenobacter TaxID=89966 RepID=A0ABR6JTB0_9BACT|nr:MULTISPECIES: sporulation protein [Hymenobacter]MBB4600052.1 putative small lipoprotein YifL [Hymenobacter latericoloratus]MBB6057638.1 putative small lipoprotein YifL [Hymenobacter luteus]
MKHLLRNVLLLSTLFSLGACASSGPAAPAASTATPDTTRRTSAAATPTEDLSRYRPVFAAPKAPAAAPATPARPVTPTNHVNPQIEQRLRDQAFTNQNVKYAQGYRILAYVGLEKEQAMAVRRAVISRYPEETDYLAYKQPIFRLWIGDYLTRLEAEQALIRIRPLAPKAELESAQVIINKTTF